MGRFYDRQGKPISDMLAWGRLFEDRDYQRVDLYEDEHVRISTVWLGIDHNWGGGPPLIFESMIFGEVPYDQLQWRYTTEEKAREGHKILVASYREDLDPTEAMEKLHEDRGHG